MENTNSGVQKSETISENASNILCYKLYYQHCNLSDKYLVCLLFILMTANCMNATSLCPTMVSITNTLDQCSINSGES